MVHITLLLVKKSVQKDSVKDVGKNMLEVFYSPPDPPNRDLSDESHDVFRSNKS